MRLTFLLVSALSLAACGSPDKGPDPVVGSDPTATTATRLTITMEGERVGELVLHGDGTVEAISERKSGKGRLVGGELTMEGDAIGRLGADGQVSVRHRSREIVDGQVVEQEETWEVVGRFDDAGVLRIAKDGRELRIVDGKVIGLPEEMVVDVELAAPAATRDALFVVIAILAASESTMESSGSAETSKQPTPVAPPTPTP